MNKFHCRDYRRKKDLHVREIRKALDRPSGSTGSEQIEKHFPLSPYPESCDHANRVPTYNELPRQSFRSASLFSLHARTQKELTAIIKNLVLNEPRYPA